MMETTTIRIDRDTKSRLEALSGDTPVARYLRELTTDLSEDIPAVSLEKRLEIIALMLHKKVITTPDLADLIVSTRMLALELGWSEKRIKLLDIFLEKASPEALTEANKDLENRILYGDDYRKIIIAELSNHIRDNVLEKLTAVDINYWMKAMIRESIANGD